MHRIDGPGATVDNHFTEGDPVGGIPATAVTDSWLNDVQEELMSVLTAGGVTPVKGTQDQVLKAIGGLIRTQNLTAFTTAGTATALTLAPVPAISAYAVSQRFSVKFSVNSGANPTLNVSAKGPKSLKQYDASGTKVAAVFVVDQISDIVYDGTDWVVLNRLMIFDQATETVAGVAKVATQAQTNAGADDTVTVTPKKLRAGFSASLTSNGYITFPSWLGGLIFQWGRVNVAPESSATVNYPISFTSQVFCTFATINAGTWGTTGNYSAYGAAISNSQLSVVQDVSTTGGASTQQVSWLSIGI